MSLVFGLLGLIVNLYVFILLARVVLDIVQMTARDWRPQGVALVLSNLVYLVTDPPLRFLSRYIPPLRLGPVSLDIGFLVLLIALNFLGRVLYALQ